VGFRYTTDFTVTQKLPDSQPSRLRPRRRRLRPAPYIPPRQRPSHYSCAMSSFGVYLLLATVCVGALWLRLSGTARDPAGPMPHTVWHPMMREHRACAWCAAQRLRAPARPRDERACRRHRGARRHREQENRIALRAALRGAAIMSGPSAGDASSTAASAWAAPARRAPRGCTRASAAPAACAP